MGFWGLAGVPLSLNVAVNMRGRLPGRALTDDDVGMYSGVSHNLPYLKGGLDMAAPFWAAAREVREATLAYMSHPLARNAHLYGHKVFGDAAKLRHILLANSEGFVGDVATSNLGRYPFPLDHQPASGGAARHDGMHIDRVHCVVMGPGMGFSAATGIVVVSTDRMTYSWVHHLPPLLGCKLFDMIVAGVEAVGSVSDSEAVAEFSKRVWRPWLSS